MIGPGRKTLASLDIRGISNIAHVISTLYDKRGVPSALHDYCNDAVRRGYSKFVLVAVQLGKSWFASGVHQRDPEGCPSFQEIRAWYYAQFGYWRRLLPIKLEFHIAEVMLDHCRCNFCNQHHHKGSSY